MNPNLEILLEIFDRPKTQKRITDLLFKTYKMKGYQDVTPLLHTSAFTTSRLNRRTVEKTFSFKEIEHLDYEMIMAGYREITSHLSLKANQNLLKALANFASVRSSEAAYLQINDTYILYDKAKVSPIILTTEDTKKDAIYKDFHEFMFLLNEAIADEKAHNNLVLFRGQNNTSYISTPSIFRNRGHLTSEARICDEIIHRAPQDFDGLTSSLERLVHMQHFGIPTRLIDVTVNPMVALYFACSGSPHDTVGEVILHTVPEQEVKYSRSDTVSILAGLHGLSFETQTDLYNYSTNFTKFEKLEKLIPNIIIETYESLQRRHPMSEPFDAFKEQMDTLTYNFRRIRRSLNDPDRLEKQKDRFFDDFENAQNFLVDLHDKYPEVIYPKLMELNQIEQEIFRVILSLEWHASAEPEEFLLHQIRLEKPAFADSINLPDLLTNVVSLPDLKNQRIINQDGGFIICGLRKEYYGSHAVGGPIYLPRHLGKKVSTTLEKEHIFFVEPDAREEILDKLDNYSINNAKLFPELPDVSEYVKAKFET